MTAGGWGTRSQEPRFHTLTRAGRRQVIPRRLQSPGAEINTQDHGPNGGCECKLEEVIVHVIKLHVPEQRCSDESRCQDKSIESLKKKKAGGGGVFLSQGSQVFCFFLKK